MKLPFLLKHVENKLKDSCVESYRIDSSLLISHHLNLTKEDLIFNSELVVEKSDFDKIEALVDRRIAGEPVSHIISKRGFYEDEFLVNSDVLDPRPDSEVIIESILGKYQNRQSNLNILELGVGSGCLVLSVLKQFPLSGAIAIDISQKALEVAKKNATKLNLSTRIKFLESSWFDKVEKQEFDLIISNPPYIESDAIDNLQVEVREYEPRLALDGGKDGLDCYREIAKNVTQFLKKEGCLFLEIGIGQEDAIVSIFEEGGLEFVNSKKDLASIIRCLIFKKV